MGKDEQTAVIDHWFGLLQQGRVSRRAFVGRMALLGVSATTIGWLLDACGPSNSTTTTGQPKRGGTMTIGYQVEIPQLEPHTSPGTSSVRFHQLIYNSMLKFDASLKPVGDLVADGWNVSSDGSTYTFTLKPNVKFSNGDPLTSEDTKYSLDRV